MGLEEVAADVLEELETEGKYDRYFCNIKNAVILFRREPKMNCLRLNYQSSSFMY